jgi:hypothetical protein
MQLNKTIELPVVFENERGVPTAPTVGPAFVLRKNNALVVGSTDVVISGSAGSYKYRFLSNSLNFAVGDEGSIVATGTVDGVAMEIPLASFTIDPVYFSAADVAAAVWAYGGRTLTGFGTLVADIWAHATRRVSNIDDTRAAKIDNLDANVGSRSSHSPLDVWNVSINAAFLPNTLGAWKKAFMEALGLDKRVKISSDVHTSGVTVADVANKEGYTPDAETLTTLSYIAAKVAALGERFTYTTPSVENGQRLEFVQGVKNVVNFDFAGDLSNRTWMFGVKDNSRKTDAQAKLLARQGVGLQRLNGSTSVTAGDAAITSLYDAESDTTTVSLTVKALTATQVDLPEGVWGLKAVGDEALERKGKFVLVDGVVDAVA